MRYSKSLTEALREVQEQVGVRKVDFADGVTPDIEPDIEEAKIPEGLSKEGAAEFMAAASAAKKAGKKTFKFGDKEYTVTIKVDIPTSKKEENELEEAKPEFEVKYSSSKKGPIKVTKFMSLKDAQKFLAQVKKEGMNGMISMDGKVIKFTGNPIKSSHMMMNGKMNASYHKDKMNASYHKEENEVNEATTDMGAEYNEQEWDLGARLDNAYPNLNVSFAKFMEEDLEGPYMFEDETYFFDRKMGSWFSVSGEDYVDEDMNKTLSYNFIKSELVRVN